MSHFNGFKLKEINVAQLPSSLFQGLQLVTKRTGILRTNDVESADQVWVIECPKNVNLVSLIEGKKLTLDSTRKSIFSEEDKVYESSCIADEESRQGISLIIPNESDKIKLVSAPLSGTILIRETLEEMDEPQVIQIPKPRHVLPEGIKIRHPIYGADFTNILSEMESAPDSDQPDSSKKKHKRKDKSREEIIPLPPQFITPESTNKKHSKKRKLDYDEVEPEFQEHVAKKPKKARHEFEVLSQSSELEIVEAEESTSKKHKKKNKDKKHDIGEEEPEEILLLKVENMEEEPTSNGHNHKKKKKHKKSKYE